jgi:hypothetical protein
VLSSTFCFGAARIFMLPGELHWRRSTPQIQSSPPAGMTAS